MMSSSKRTLSYSAFQLSMSKLTKVSWERKKRWLLGLRRTGSDPGSLLHAGWPGASQSTSLYPSSYVEWSDISHQAPRLWNGLLHAVMDLKD